MMKKTVKFLLMGLLFLYGCSEKPTESNAVTNEVTNEVSNEVTVEDFEVTEYEKERF